MDALNHPENGTVLGVDLGIENIAVTSTGTFWSADELTHWRTEYVERRRRSGMRYTVGARERPVGRTHRDGAFRAVPLPRGERTGCRSSREWLFVHPFERLTNIRERIPRARKFHEWAFHRLYGYVEYKAEACGISVEQVNPAYTSQRCSTCGFTVEANRDREGFACQSCGYENHVDYNAAKTLD